MKHWQSCGVLYSLCNSGGGGAWHSSQHLGDKKVDFCEFQDTQGCYAEKPRLTKNKTKQTKSEAKTRQKTANVEQDCNFITIRLFSCGILYSPAVKTESVEQDYIIAITLMVCMPYFL